MAQRTQLDRLERLRGLIVELSSSAQVSLNQMINVLLRLVKLIFFVSINVDRIFLLLNVQEQLPQCEFNLLHIVRAVELLVLQLLLQQVNTAVFLGAFLLLDLFFRLHQELLLRLKFFYHH